MRERPPLETDRDPMLVSQEYTPLGHSETPYRPLGSLLENERVNEGEASLETDRDHMLVSQEYTPLGHSETPYRPLGSLLEHERVNEGEASP